MIHQGVRADNTGTALPVGSANRTRKVPMTRITVHKLPLPDRKKPQFLRPIHAGLGRSTQSSSIYPPPANGDGANQPTSAARVDEPTSDAATKP
jgi:hypothetical protein